MQRLYEVASRQNEALVDRLADEDRLFSLAGERDWKQGSFDNGLPVKIFNLFETDEDVARAYFSKIRKNTVKISWDELEKIVCLSRARQLLIVSIDGAIPLGKLVDDLIDCRMNCRELVVIIISKDFMSDELEVHRRAVCDATLKSPISSSRLDQVIRTVIPY